MSLRDRFLTNDAKLSQLDPGVRERFEGVVKRLESAGWRPKVVETRRSRARQVMLKALGRSWTWNSLHVQGRAMDVIAEAYDWPGTPLMYMIELAFAAREEGLSTGLFWDMPQTTRSYAEQLLVRGTRAELFKFLGVNGRGKDPCHVEAPL